MTAADHAGLRLGPAGGPGAPPVLRWRTCRKTDQCATARLPLDYHHPGGAKITLALLRIRAADPRRRLGTIFVNPGGPGDSARAFAALLPQAVPRVILDRFDIVGVDPRGVGGSTPLRCFATRAAQARALAPFSPGSFPVTAAQQRSWIGAARALGRACSTTGRPIASAMSTTDDALDMDVLRRAVGDRKLTYFGESYGSYLGLVYANMFPGRVRALVIDGIIDPPELVGTPATASVPVFDRLGSAAASDRALRELLELCQRACGPGARSPARTPRPGSAGWPPCSGPARCAWPPPASEPPRSRIRTWSSTPSTGCTTPADTGACSPS